MNDCDEKYCRQSASYDARLQLATHLEKDKYTTKYEGQSSRALFDEYARAYPTNSAETELIYIHGTGGGLRSVIRSRTRVKHTTLVEAAAVHEAVAEMQEPSELSSRLP
jgi:hypothetical protein